MWPQLSIVTSLTEIQPITGLQISEQNTDAGCFWPRKRLLDSQYCIDFEQKWSSFSDPELTRLFRGAFRRAFHMVMDFQYKSLTEASQLFYES